MPDTRDIPPYATTLVELLDLESEKIDPLGVLLDPRLPGENVGIDTLNHFGTEIGQRAALDIKCNSEVFVKRRRLLIAQNPRLGDLRRITLQVALFIDIKGDTGPGIDGNFGIFRPLVKIGWSRRKRLRLITKKTRFRACYFLGTTLELNNRTGVMQDGRGLSHSWASFDLLFSRATHPFAVIFSIFQSARPSVARATRPTGRPSPAEVI